MDKKKLISFDTETHPIRTGMVAPPMVCLSACMYEGHELATTLKSTGDGEELDLLVESIIDSDTVLVAHNAPFDLAVIASRYPHLMSLIWERLAQGHVHDTQVRESLLNLADTGNLEYLELPDGSNMKLKYDLASLEIKYLGIDRSGEKEASDAWRTNYNQLDGVPVSEWPEDASRYAIDDARGTLMVYSAQETRRRQLIEAKGFDPFKTQGFQTAVAYALHLMTCRGVKVDIERKQEIEKMLEEELSSDKLSLLIKEGILRPAKPPRPHANGARDHVEGCSGKDCDCPPRMTKGSAASINKKKLIEYVLDFARKQNQDSEDGKRVVLKYNIPTDTERAKAASRMEKAEKIKDLKALNMQAVLVAAEYFRERPPEFDNREDAIKYIGKARGTLSLTSEFFKDYCHLDPVLEQYKHRQDLQKLVTTEIPRMNDPETGLSSPVVHPNFAVLKSTGRTSSFAGKLYASFNCQNVDPRARGCYVPRDGHLLASIDYNQMELGTLAQKCLDLFGHSVLADLINEGIDVHAYLGAQMAHQFDADFLMLCSDRGASSQKDVYKVFAELETAESEEQRAFFKKYRTFAKPTDLGYPGGLGAATFVAYAKATFGVIITEQEAREFKDIWLTTFPEMGEYFKYINNDAKDPYNEPVIKTFEGEDGEVYEKEIGYYHYESPFGLYRAGADYCAAANGMGLQTPSAEGAKAAVFNVQRGCWDPAMGSPLYGKAWGLAFIHDELLVELVDDGNAHEYVQEIIDIMVDSMRLVTPDVAARASAALMRRWDKRAEAVYDEQGRLTVWEPS